jgi:hypothetical protein
MDPVPIIKKAYEIFLELEAFDKISLVYIFMVWNINDEIKDLIEKGEYEKAMRKLIYTVMTDINNEQMYEIIRTDLMNMCIDLLHGIDESGIEAWDNLKEFINIVRSFSLYTLANKEDLKTNKEKQESINNKLKELVNLYRSNLKWTQQQ